MNGMNGLSLLMSSARGVYIPQQFAEDCLSDPSSTTDGWEYSEWAKSQLLLGPENTEYWDAWHKILDGAKYRSAGHIYELYQDGDLWVLCWDLMTLYERVNWRETLGKDWDDVVDLSGDDPEGTFETLMAIMDVPNAAYSLDHNRGRTMVTLYPEGEAPMVMGFLSDDGIVDDVMQVVESGKLRG